MNLPKNTKPKNSKSFVRRMITFLIRLTSVLAVLISLMIGVFWYIIENKKDWIVEEIQSFVNDNNSGELQIGSIEFLPLKHFPKAGFKLNKVKYYELKKSLRKEDEAPFFKAVQFDADIDIWSLAILSKLKMDNINLIDISLYIKKEDNNSLNFSEAISIFVKKIQEQIEEFEVNILELSSKEKEEESDNMPTISFNINQVLYKYKKFENIENIEITGELYETDEKIYLDLTKLMVEMPYGSVNISATLSINNEDELKVNTQLNINDFPYNYVINPIEEMVPYMNPTTKIWVQDSLAKINMDLNLSSLIQFQPFKIKNLNISYGKLDFIPVDKPQIELDSISLKANNISFIVNKKKDRIIGLKSIEGEMEIDKVKVFPISETEVDLSFTGKDNNLSIDFALENDALTIQDGSVKLDLSKKEKSYSVQFFAEEIDIEKLIDSNKIGRISRGKIHLLVDVQTSGLKLFNLTHNLYGKVKFSGSEVTMYGMNIDALLKTYDRTQKFNLVDISAFLLAGPIGAVTTKGTDLLKLSNSVLKKSDSTYVSDFIADFKISKGQLITEDVAISTLKNRIAFLGIMDWAKDTIPNITVAVLDKNGCAKIKQKFYGKADDIQVAKVKTLQVVFGSVKNAVNSVFGKKCKPVYTGTIGHPESE